MKKVVRIALVVIALLVAIPIFVALSGKAHAAEVVAQPSTMSSLQPFARFDEGEGHGYATEYVVRNKTQFVAWLRTGKKLVDCSVFVRQIAQAHPGFPGEACEGSAHEIETSTDYAVVTCADQMLKDNWLAVTDTTGKKFGIWHRRCYAGEQLLTYKGRPVASTTCGNPLIPVAKTVQAAIVPQAAPAVASGTCPNGYLLVANAWSLSAMPQGLRDTAMKLVNEAEERDSENASKMDAYKPSAFSRTLGGQLRREVKTRADVNTRIMVNLRDPVTFKVVQILDAMEMVSGIGKMSLTKNQVAMIVETIWPNGFLSPAMSGGERRVELFPNEWGKWCEMNVHGAKP